jgi:AbrB family looped-hinge helix DNA binding protein
LPRLATIDGVEGGMLMATARVDAQGRITVPKSVRDGMGAVAGTRIEFVKLKNGEWLLVPIKRPVTGVSESE